MLSFIILTLTSFVWGADIFEISNADRENTVGFIQGDDQRDTISLLISCFATLGLCVYSAVHLNVPRKGERPYRVLIRELKWCMVGLFAPELILYTAWRQLASARQLQFEVTKAINENHAQNPSRHKDMSVSSEQYVETQEIERWSIAHGFYGVMGGFAVDTDFADGNFSQLFGNVKRLTLTAKGIVLLAHCGHVPEISMEDINDKNKADGLAKLLVCIQAGWMIIQVIFRTATGLPTSLLEVHTVAHVVCATVMYVIWWHKPRQIESPTLLKDEKLQSLLAYMFLASRMSGEKPTGKSGIFRNPLPQLKRMVYFENTETPEALHQTLSIDTSRTISNGRFGPHPKVSSTDRPTCISNA